MFKYKSTMHSSTTGGILFKRPQNDPFVRGANRKSLGRFFTNQNIWTPSVVIKIRFHRTCLNFLFLGENEVLLMTFGPKWTNRSSATKRIFGIKGRRMTHFSAGGEPQKEISLNRFIEYYVA
jgi:hypothetical protein